MKDKELTPADKQGAQNLRRIWEEWQRQRVQQGEKRLSQEKVGAILGMTQGAVSQYLNGTTPLGIKAVLDFAHLFTVHPADIRPDFAYEVREQRNEEFIRDGYGSLQPRIGARALHAVPHLRSWRAVLDWVKSSQLPEEKWSYVHTTAKVGSRAYALSVSGDIMEPEFPAGSIIIVDPDSAARHEAYVIVHIDELEQLTFRQLIHDAGREYLKPANKQYPILELDRPYTYCGTVMRMEKNFYE